MLHPRTWKGISIGSFLEAVLTALSLVAVFALDGVGIEPVLFVAFFAFAISFSIAFLGCLLIGIPIHLGLRKIRGPRWNYIAAAFVLSAALAAVIPEALLGRSVFDADRFELMLTASIVLGPLVVASGFLWVTRKPGSEHEFSL